MEGPHIIISANKGNNSLLLHLIPLSGPGLCNYPGYGALAQKATSAGTGGRRARWGFTTCPLHARRRQSCCGAALHGRPGPGLRYVEIVFNGRIYKPVRQVCAGSSLRSQHPCGENRPLPFPGRGQGAGGISRRSPGVLPSTESKLASKLCLFPFLGKAASAPTLSK